MIEENQGFSFVSPNLKITVGNLATSTSKIKGFRRFKSGTLFSFAQNLHKNEVI
jgi:hypothetical protein